MNLRNVLLIFRREVLDQLRDRRTLFMVAVLPILLYPLLGIGMAQMTEGTKGTVMAATASKEMDRMEKR